MAKATRTTTGRSNRTASTSATTKKAASTASAASKPTASLNDDFDELDELQFLNELEAAAEDAAAAAAEAKAAYIARRRQAQAAATAQATSRASKNTNANPGTNPAAGSVFGEGGNLLDGLSRAFENMSSNDWDSDSINDMTQGVGLVLGSGPAFATLGSMLANSTAQGSILMNATQMQRQLDQVGLCCTSACVKQLLSMNDTRDTD